jgi:beta-lactamase regulating signal transducer with metallopeptidase domain/protocatechuate 3,4-dioxygenase beta subunit
MSIIDCLLSNAAVAAILALVAAVVGRVTTKPQIRHALWVLVLVKLVTPPVVQIPIIYANSESFGSETGLTSNVAVSEARTVDVPIEVHHETEDRADSAHRPQQALPFPPVVNPEAKKGADARPALEVPWSKVVIGVWVAGSFMWFSLVAVRLVRFKRVLQYAQPAPEDIQAQVRTIARRYGLQRLPRVMLVDATLPPLICGFGARTCMVLPSRLLSNLGTDERAGLLAHELAHLRRYDHWIRWLEFLVLGVHWWNPLAWWARAHVQQAEEECCDAWVLWAFPNKARLYAQTLIDTVDYLTGLARVKPAIATAFNQGHSLKRRIEMIVSQKVSRRLSWRTKTVLVLFAAIVAPLSLLGSPSEEAEGKASHLEEKASSSEERKTRETGTDKVSGSPVLVAESKGTTTQEAQPASETPEDHVTLQGRVVGPDGEPLAGANIYVRTSYDSNIRRDSPTRATTGKDGTFRFSMTRSEFSALWGDGVLRFVQVIARAEGYAPDWGNGLEKDGVTLRLVEAGPAIRGRVTDGNGRPVTDANVSVLQLSTSQQEDLAAWAEALRTAKEARALENRFLRKVAFTNLLGQILPPVEMGPDGTFVMNGVGAKRIVTLRVEGPTIETSIINVMTRPAERVELPDYRDAPDLGRTIYYGATFEHRVRPAKPVVGVVRDKDTGESLAGVRLRGEPSLGGSSLIQWVETTSDAQGKYRLTGLPRRTRTNILAIPPDDQPYMLSQLKVKDDPGTKETTLDFAMKRGLWIEGQVTDKATGEPVKRAAVFYYVFSDNPHAKDAPGLDGAYRGWIDSYYISPEGSFRRVGLPGRGLIAVRVSGSDEYRFGMGADKIEGGRAMQDSVLFRTAPYTCNSGSFNALTEVNPKEDQDRYECNVSLDSGSTVTGEVLDPDGQPLIGALVWGDDDFGGPWAHEPLTTSTFRAKAYDPAKPRQLFFLHKERRLAGGLRIEGEDPGELAVRLQPWATISGRVLDANGEPKGGVRIDSDSGPKQEPAAPLPRADRYSNRPFYTDDEGCFEIEGLIPGAKYILSAADESTNMFAVILFQTVLSPGEVKAVGDVQLEDAEILRERWKEKLESMGLPVTE